jgi:hypothetical protein
MKLNLGNKQISNNDLDIIGTNGKLKRYLAINVFANLRYIMYLLVFTIAIISFSGDGSLSITFGNTTLTIPAISSTAATAILSIASFMLGKLTSERDLILNHYYGSNVINEKNKQDNYDKDEQRNDDEGRRKLSNRDSESI